MINSMFMCVGMENYLCLLKYTDIYIESIMLQR